MKTKSNSPKNAKPRGIEDLLEVMARLRAPGGCPWDREQDHRSIRMHAVEEVYELIDAIEAGDDHEMEEELGDLLLQVVFHSQLAKERKAFDFGGVCRHIVEKLIRRHPHVFGDKDVRDVDTVWAQWEQIKRSEKAGTRHERASALDGIPKHLPALMRAQKLVKKAKKAGLDEPAKTGKRWTQSGMAKELLAMAEYAQKKGWSAEALLKSELKKREAKYRRAEKSSNRTKSKAG